MTVAWARLKDRESWKRTRAHLVLLPIVDQRTADCGYPLDGHEWMAQEADDTLPRCGRCQEAERNWLKGKVA